MPDEKKIEHKVYDWLESHGYPLELRVAKALREIGFDIGQSVHYNTPSGESREIDTIAFKFFSEGGFQFCCILVIECKTSKDKPWVAFKHSNQVLSKDTFIRQISVNDRGKPFRKIISQDPGIQNLLIFNQKKSVFNVTRAFTDNNIDVTFSAIKSVISARNFLVNFGNDHSISDIRIYFPIIITDALLFESYLNIKNDLVVKPTEYVRFVKRISSAKNYRDILFPDETRMADIVDIICEGSLKKIASRYLADIKKAIKSYLKNSTKDSPTNNNQPQNDNEFEF